MSGALETRYAYLWEFPKLMSMWRICFGDSEAAADNLFNYLQNPENILVGLVDGEPAAMLCLREFMLTSPRISYKAAYIYGVATLPEHRGKGYSSALLNDADALLKTRGNKSSVLVPATEELFKFYGKRGYKTAFNLNKAGFTQGETGEGEAFPLELVLSAERFAMIRDACFSDSKMYVRWDEDYLNYIIEESRFYGGGVFAFSHVGRQACAVCHRSGDTVYVRELAVTRHMLDASLRSLSVHFADAKNFVLYLREDVKISYTNNLLPFGMIKWYDNSAESEMESGGGEPAYITHALD